MQRFCVPVDIADVLSTKYIHSRIQTATYEYVPKADSINRRGDRASLKIDLSLITK